MYKNNKGCFSQNLIIVSFVSQSLTYVALNLLQLLANYQIYSKHANLCARQNHKKGMTNQIIPGIENY